MGLREHACLALMGVIGARRMDGSKLSGRKRCTN
jgi:hypothetical protein